MYFSPGAITFLYKVFSLSGSAFLVHRWNSVNTLLVLSWKIGGRNGSSALIDFRMGGGGGVRRRLGWGKGPLCKSMYRDVSPAWLAFFTKFCMVFKGHKFALFCNFQAILGYWWQINGFLKEKKSYEVVYFGSYLKISSGSPLPNSRGDYPPPPPSLMTSDKILLHTHTKYT